MAGSAVPKTEERLAGKTAAEIHHEIIRAQRCIESHAEDARTGEGILSRAQNREAIREWEQFIQTAQPIFLLKLGNELTGQAG